MRSRSIAYVALLVSGTTLTVAAILALYNFRILVGITGVALMLVSQLCLHRRESTATGSPLAADLPSRQRANSWPAYCAGLLALLNGITLAILFADNSLRIDGELSATMVRDAFISVTLLNLILTGLILVSFILAHKANQQPPTETP